MPSSGGYPISAEDAPRSSTYNSTISTRAAASSVTRGQRPIIYTRRLVQAVAVDGWHQAVRIDRTKRWRTGIQRHVGAAGIRQPVLLNDRHVLYGTPSPSAIQMGPGRAGAQNTVDSECHCLGFLRPMELASFYHDIAERPGRHSPPPPLR
jgi:hypothetical protein